MFQTEIDEVRAIAERIEHLADRSFAHYDSRGVSGRVPSFNEIGESLRVFERIIRRYKMLLDGASNCPSPADIYLRLEGNLSLPMDC